MNLFVGLISLTFFIYLFFIATTYFAFRKVLAHLFSSTIFRKPRWPSWSGCSWD